MKLGGIDLLTTFCPPVHERGLSLSIFSTSLITFIRVLLMTRILLIYHVNLTHSWLYVYLSISLGGGMVIDFCIFTLCPAV